MSEDIDFDLVRRAYAAFSAGDLEEFEKLLDPAVVHVVPGTHSMAGTFRGAAAVPANLRDTAAATDGMNVVVQRMFADLDGRIIAIDRTRATRKSRTIDETGAILFTLADGRITQLVEFYADPDAAFAFAVLQVLSTFRSESCNCTESRLSDENSARYGSGCHHG